MIGYGSEVNRALEKEGLALREEKNALSRGNTPVRQGLQGKLHHADDNGIRPHSRPHVAGCAKDFHQFHHPSRRPQQLHAENNRRSFRHPAGHHRNFFHVKAQDPERK